MTSGRLTSDEIHTARRMRREGKTIRQIAQQLGRSRGVIREVCGGYVRVVQQQVQVVNVPEHVLAERDRRLAQRPRDLTAAIAGDPLPGMSALEKRARAASVAGSS
jgi:IS30 family transposase